MRRLGRIARTLVDGPFRRADNRAKSLLRETRGLVRRAGSALAPEQKQALTDSLLHVRLARQQGHLEMLEAACDRLETQQERFLSRWRRSGWLESVESVGYAVVVALLLRAVVVEAFKIPSGSMIPTLAIGDQIFVNKFHYGPRVPFTSLRPVALASPKRGEVIVFVSPVPPHDDYIKRIVAIAGDEVAVHGGVVEVNGERLGRQALGQVTHWDRDASGSHWRPFEAQAFCEHAGENVYVTLEDDGLRRHAADFGPYVVPMGHVFVMGDNRDHSSDSRAWGPVPGQNILGRAIFVWWSWGEQGLRTERLGRAVR